MTKRPKKPRTPTAKDFNVRLVKAGDPIFTERWNMSVGAGARLIHFGPKDDKKKKGT